MRRKCNAETNGRSKTGEVKLKLCVCAQSYTSGHTRQPRAKAFPHRNRFRFFFERMCFSPRGHCKQTHDAMWDMNAPSTLAGPGIRAKNAPQSRALDFVYDERPAHAHINRDATPHTSGICQHRNKTAEKHTTQQQRPCPEPDFGARTRSRNSGRDTATKPAAKR